MTREEKVSIVEGLKTKFDSSQFFYLTDASTMTVEKTNELRAKCHESGVEMKVLKNSLVKKALEAAPEDKNYGGLFELLKGPTAILFSDTANVPGKLLKEFRLTSERPILKGAYIDSSIYVGDEMIKELASLKSKEDLIGEIVSLLQSPAKNVLGALQSGGNTIAGLVKALEERA